MTPLEPVLQTCTHPMTTGINVPPHQRRAPMMATMRPVWTVVGMGRVDGVRRLGDAGVRADDRGARV